MMMGIMVAAFSASYLIYVLSEELPFSLANESRRFRVEVIPGQTIEIGPLFGLHGKGLILDVKRSCQGFPKKSLNLSEFPDS
ncbi:MAG: hypothetical protein EOP10_24850 [Proteobacteria bacterium]|nr:MAG: hypothetical protein EOP10_24850 [Pseudomonadota bacterium]